MPIASPVFQFAVAAGRAVDLPPAVPVAVPLALQARILLQNLIGKFRQELRRQKLLRKLLRARERVFLAVQRQGQHAVGEDTRIARRPVRDGEAFAVELPRNLRLLPAAEYTAATVLQLKPHIRVAQIRLAGRNRHADIPAHGIIGGSRPAGGEKQQQAGQKQYA